MQQSQPSGIKALSILHLALLAGQILFALISLFIVYGKGYTANPSWQNETNLFVFLCVTVGVAGYLAGSMIFRKKLEQINGNTKSVVEKFNDYRAASISRWALMEFAVLFCIIIFFITNNPIIIILGGICILLFFSLRPTLQKAASDLGINEIEIQQMNLDNPGDQ